MVKAVMIGIASIVLISLVAVVMNDASVTGLSAYGYTSKLYGPGLKKAYKNPEVFGKKFSQSLFIQRNQEYMLANKDKWVCTFDTSDGSNPCMYDDSLKKWCCMPGPGGTDSMADPKYVKKVSVRPETKLTGIAPIR